MRWLTCKQPAGNGPCGLQFHPDDREDFIDHLKAHGVDTSALDKKQWWEEEVGKSISPTERLKNTTDTLPSQFGDGSNQQRKENAQSWRKLKDLQDISSHDTPAWKFEDQAPIAEGRAAPDFKPAKAQAPSQSAPAPGRVKSAGPSARGLTDLAGGLREREAAVKTARKEPKMKTTTNSNSPRNPYRNASVINLGAGSNATTTGAPRFCVTTGRGYTDSKAILNILELIQKNHPNAVVTNQGRWQGDQIVANVARGIGLSYETTLPKFLEARNAGRPLIDPDERMTPEQDAEFGFRALQETLAEKCVELHVFGVPSGPQRGLTEAFEDANKSVFGWGASTD